MNGQDKTQNKENWQERQRERELESKRAKRKGAAKRIGYWALALAAIFVLGWRYIATSSPKGPDLSESVLTLGRGHIADGTKAGAYNSNPPTSGPHYSQPANASFYTAELPDERVVHNLEHGNIWIAYQPHLSQGAIDVLRGFAGGLVIVTPRAANDADIALAAWGHLDKFNLENGAIDTRRIKDFILRYQNQGPEKIGIPGRIR